MYNKTMHKRANNNAIIKYIIIGFLIISPIIIAPVVVFLLFNKQKIVPIGDYEISTSISPTTIRNGETKEITSSKINVNNEIATNDFLDYLSCNTSNNEYYSQTLIINDLSISVDDGIVIISISINETNTFYGVFKFRIYFSMKNIEASTSSSTIVELNILKDGLN
jgi:hypothetical protein